MGWENREADHVGQVLRRESLALLALSCSVAFTRFTHIYLKYYEDQPRDKSGLWTDTGASDDIDTTGALQTVYNERTGNLNIDAITEKLNEVLKQVVDEYGPGVGPTYGTAIHYDFAARVRELNIPDLGVEVSFDDGYEVKYGTEGSVRTDIVLRDFSEGKSGIAAIWDAKTGVAEITPSRADVIRDKVGGTSDTPLIQIHAFRGIRNKELADVLRHEV